MTRADGNYTASIEVSASLETCFDAVAKRMNEWWTETTDGMLNEVGDTIKVMFPPDYGHWTFEATRLEPGSAIELLCRDADHHVEGQPEEIKEEWLGTKIVWGFQAVGPKTRVTLTHEGLTPRLKCWEICLDGWDHFFKNSLASHLEGGDASPHRAARGS